MPNGFAGRERRRPVALIVHGRHRRGIVPRQHVRAFTVTAPPLVHPRLADVLAQFDAHAATLDRAVAAIPPTLRARRPAPDRWSAAEVMAHVALVEGRIGQLLATHIDAARATGLGAEQATTDAGSPVDLTRLLDRSRPIVAGEAVLPQAGIDAAAAADALARQRETIRATLRAADGLALSEVTATHARFGTLNMYQWTLFVAVHEARHAAQVAEAAAQLATLQGIDGAT